MKMSAMAAVWNEDLRLAVLRLLDEAPGKSLNDSLITKGVQLLGIQATRAQVQAALNHLESLMAVEQEPLGALIVAKLREAGDLHIRALTQLPGVSAPSVR